MLPIFINKNHWQLVKSFWKYHMSFINNSFEYNYNKRMDNIYFLVLLKNFNNLNESYNLNKIKLIPDCDIRLFIYILRTSIQILIDNKYINNIKNEYNRTYLHIIDIHKTIHFSICIIC